MAGSKDGFEFANVLFRTVAPVMASSSGTFQTRQILLANAAEALGPEMKTVAMQNLANATSLGGLIEFFISPHLGRLSDKHGRRPFFIFYVTLPCLTRSICYFVREPQTRVWLLLGDLVGARCLTVQPMLSSAGTMISDKVCPTDQPRIRSLISACVAIGQIVGNYAAGYSIATFGPELTYAGCAVVPALLGMYAAAALPETNPARVNDASIAIKASMPGDTTSSKGAFRTIMCDVECGLLSLTLASYEMMNWPSVVAMSFVFLKERFGWTPLQIGRFASGHGLASFLGSLISARVLKILGSQGQVSFAHFCFGVHWMLWGSARNGSMLGCALLPLGFAVQAQPVVMTRYVARAAQLGVGKGEAAAVTQSMGAVGKMLAPVLYMRLVLKAVASRKNMQKGWRLPLGTPMLFMAMLTFLQELMHRITLRAQRKRELASAS